MLEQMKFMLAQTYLRGYSDIDFKIWEIKNKKIIRQLERMESESNAVATKAEEV